MISTKKRKNPGFSQIDNIDITSLSEKASLKENKSGNEDNTEKEFVNFQCRLPKKFHSIIKRGILDNKITGSLNSYVVEAVKKRLIKEGFIDTNISKVLL